MLKIRYPAKFTFSNNFDIIGVQIRSFSGPYFPIFSANKKKTEKNSVFGHFSHSELSGKLFFFVGSTFDCHYL